MVMHAIFFFFSNKGDKVTWCLIIVDRPGGRKGPHCAYAAHKQRSPDLVIEMGEESTVSAQ